ncbi:MAG: type 4a pilus biogenesis protein PilO [Tatlockia sp.]|nr:type 4a pilus biogenesis protein PilO [Tatlockia sp.]
MKQINLNLLTFDNFYYWPNSLKYFMLFFIAILLLTLNYGLILSSSLHRYKYLNHDEMSLKMEFEKKQPLANLQAYQEQLNRVENIYEKGLKQLVKEDEISSLVNDISQAGVSSGLIIEFFAPIALEKKELSKNLIIKMEVVGEYHCLSLFLAKISDLNRLITFENFEVINESINNKINNFLRMKITAKIYRYYE